ncbi:DUF4198 domain-containing protein [Sulfitobacter albidus]|uniref:DUF4198 domain-containing protein n=1 Tax=Sulfitobacter albidus TaxID=2829501 RepID=A0A975PNN4_9RHOB|nr:DUF4198 domain-containing protein [Sulfitobacter albidus]QUJ77646.1 DUF4198 domain-containing protein [Sulfitobacter albidus]
MFGKYLIALCFCAALGTTASAHEFWIEPEEYQVETGEAVVANLRNGELFDGSRQSFFPRNNTRLDFALGDELAPVEGRLGDRPAIQVPAPLQDGLMVLLHEAAPSTLTYRSWEKFLKFVDHKDFADAVATHEARGWAKEDFKETYTRHSKSLVAVGDGEGADRAFGLATEFVAQDNPYAVDFDGTMDVTLFYGDVVRGDAQVEVYEKDAQGEVSVTVLRTDAGGALAVPVKSGHSYLLDAVVLREAAGATSATDGPLWETLWAALTFAVP